ncbi:MAG: hypothetical protein VX000_03820, partial [Myxococcota bacterium]|nr:hypothetical protein [Myxococcota bacterium]
MAGTQDLRIHGDRGDGFPSNTCPFLAQFVRPRSTSARNHAGTLPADTDHDAEASCKHIEHG